MICSEVRVEGLETLDYFDNMMERERFTEQADAITFDGEVPLTWVPFTATNFPFYFCHLHPSEANWNNAHVLFHIFINLLLIIQ